MTNRTRTRGAVGVPFQGTQWTSNVAGTFHLPGGQFLNPGSYQGSTTFGYTDTTASIEDTVDESRAESELPGYVKHSCIDWQERAIRETPYHITLRRRPEYAPYQEAALDLTVTHSACSGALQYYASKTLIPDYGVSAVALSRCLSDTGSTQVEQRRMLVSLCETGDLLEGVTGTLLRLLLGVEVKTGKNKYVPAFGLSQATIKQLPQGLRRFRRILHELANKSAGDKVPWVKYSKELGLNSPSALIRTLVGLDLEWKFAVKPLFDDINHLRSVYGNWKKNLTDLALKPSTVKGKYSNSTVGEYPAQSYTLGPHANLGITESLRCSSKTTTTVVFGAIKRLNTAAIPSLDEVAWERARESLGLNPRVSDAWQLRPMSFVLDWFIPVQDFLDQFVVPDQSMAGWFIESGAWKSTKVEHELTITSKMRQTTTSSMLEVVAERGFLSRHVYYNKSYVRESLSKLPNISEVPIFVPNLRLPARAGQWVTGMELIVSGLLSGRVPRRYLRGSN